MNRRDAIEVLGRVFFFLRDTYVAESIVEAVALNDSLRVVHKLRRALWHEVYATELPTLAECVDAFPQWYPESLR
jgi:hypothetical protein